MPRGTKQDFPLRRIRAVLRRQGQFTAPAELFPQHGAFVLAQRGSVEAAVKVIVVELSQEGQHLLLFGRRVNILVGHLLQELFTLLQRLLGTLQFSGQDEKVQALSDRTRVEFLLNLGIDHLPGLTC